MAAQIEDKTQSMQYLSTCLRQFLMECGRTHAVLNNTVKQSDNEDFLIALLKATATAMGSDIAVRQSPAYTSQAQDSVERLNRTWMRQVRALCVEAERSHLRVEKPPKSLAKPPGRNTRTTWNATTSKRAQCLQDSNRQGFHPRLRGWPPILRRTNSCQQALCGHPATAATSTNKWLDSRRQC